MTTYRFSNWAKWNDRNDLSNLEYPGVYVLAISDDDLSNTRFTWLKKIIYIGMTNSKGGLRSRLRQFERTIRGNRGHGGAARVRFKHRDPEKLFKHLYLSICSVKCDVTSKMPNDLRIMGRVAKLEYDCFAKYVERYGELPEFNKMSSPKK